MVVIFERRERGAMERYDRLISFIWMVLGLAQCVESFNLGLGSVSEPGTGFMPFVMGLVMILLAVSLLLEANFTLKRSRLHKVSLWSEVHWKRVVYITMLLLAYSFLLPKLGYIIATFLVMVFLLKSGEPVKWPAAILVGALTSGLSYLIFGFWLNVSFPRGMLSF